MAERDLRRELAELRADPPRRHGWASAKAEHDRRVLELDAELVRRTGKHSEHPPRPSERPVLAAVPG
jgi:hypothetical protein